jgi:mercuric ion binding protein
MKQLLLGIALLWLSSSAATAEERTITLAIDRMTCALCPITVEKAIERVEGVEQVSIDYGTKRATVRYDDAVTSVENVAEASTNAGYPAHKVE